MKASYLRKFKKIVEILVQSRVETNNRILNKTDKYDETRRMYFNGRNSSLEEFKSEIEKLTVKKLENILSNDNDKDKTTI